MKPPPGFEFVRAGGSVVLVDETRRERYLLEGLSRPAVMLSTARPRAGGRGGALDLTIGGNDVVVRTLRRGGLVRLLLRERTWSRDRGFREVEALVAARQRGVPAVQPVAAVATPAGLGFYRQLLLTLTVPGAQDLLEALATRVKRNVDGGFRERAAIVRAAAEVVKLGFDQGIDPPDLQPRNLLLTEAVKPECLWVDLDRAVVRPGSIPPATRIAALSRFVRYVETHRAEGSAAMSRSDLLRFVKYTEGIDWRVTARAVWVRVARVRRLHRIGALWRPRVALTNRLTRRGPESPAVPAVSVLFAPRRRGDAQRAVESFLGAAEAAGLRSFELVGLARARAALDDLRAISSMAPSLRFCGFVKEDDGDAWRTLFRAARAPRIIVLGIGPADPTFLTEAFERLDLATDVVVGFRDVKLDNRGVLTRAWHSLSNYAARKLRGAPVRDPGATFVARNDDRFQAAVRALRARRFVRADVLGRLAESGARFAEVAISAPISPRTR